VIITAERDGKCRRCQRPFASGDRIHYTKGEPIYCTREDCLESAVSDGRAGVPASSYSFQRGDTVGVSHSARGGAQPEQQRRPLLPAAGAASDEPRLANLFREQQLSELLDRLLPLLRELRESLRGSAAGGR
jgi:hypothetical protein